MKYYYVAMHRQGREVRVMGAYSHEFAAYARVKRIRAAYPYADVRVIQPGGAP